MSELIGWLELSAGNKSAPTFPTSHLTASSTCDTSFVGVTAGGCDKQVHEHDGLNAGFAGHIRWSGGSLADHARQYGDAATLIYAYRKHGTAFLDKLKGRYVIAISEARTGRYLIAMDRLGTLPLYYTLLPGKLFLFASSIQALLKHPDVSAGINPQSLYDYTYFHVIPSPDTIYKNIFKLEPAQYILCDRGQLDIQYYWKPDFSTRRKGSTSQLGNELGEILQRSISSLAPLDNTGCFLSGGLDSSTVTGMFSRIQETPVDAFTIGFSEPGYDEIGYARITAGHFGAKLHEYYVTPDDIVDAFPTIAAAYDEPFGNSSAIPAYFCARLAKQHGKDCLLAGDGGDELFAGNERYAKQKLFDLYHRIPGALRKGLLEPLFVANPASQWVPPARKIRSYIEQARMPMPERMESYNFLKRTPLESIFNDTFLDSVDTRHPDDNLSRVYDRVDTDSLVDRMLYLDWKITLADNDLRKVNRMCELAGIRVQYPMLDDELVEFSTTIDPALKLKGQKLRYFFKQSLSDFLPEEIINKPKHGFGLPFGQWLKKSDRLKEIIYSNLQAMKKRQLFHEAFIDNLIQAHQTGHAAYYGSMVWTVAILEQWFHEHQVS